MTVAGLLHRTICVEPVPFSLTLHCAAPYISRFDLGKSEFYVNEVLQPDGIIGSRRIINECYNDDHELCRQTEEMTFMEALDAVINGEKTC